jgi:hypothetical protein
VVEVEASGAIGGSTSDGDRGGGVDAGGPSTGFIGAIPCSRKASPSEDSIVSLLLLLHGPLRHTHIGGYLRGYVRVRHPCASPRVSRNPKRN